MLLSDLQRLLHAVGPAVENSLGHLLLALHLRLHLHRPRRPGAFEFVVKMAGRPLAGESHILAQQIIGILPSLGSQFDAVIDALGRIAGHKLDIVNQIIQHRRIGASITRLALLVVVRLQPEITPGVPGGQLHDELFIRFIHGGRLVDRGEVGFNVQIA